MNAKTQHKTLRSIEKRMSLENRENDLRRARSVTVGTCFGGTTELMMRGNDGNVIWAPMQPVEVVELIHQLAANIGCHINLQPRNDFASWRRWNYTEKELSHYRNGGGAFLETGGGWPPHVNDLAPHKDKGAVLPPPEQQPGFQPALMARSESNEQTVATEKPVKRSRTKRPATTA